jgi:hypothetical protein
MIQPIETRYNGYRFRSRLEARWAVFFDTLGVKYAYEPEGFVLDWGVRYLPDFWLIDEQCWVEIKPERPESNSIEWQKCDLLARHSGHTVILFSGPIGHPRDEPNTGLAFLPTGEQRDYWWGECIHCMLDNKPPFITVARWGEHAAACHESSVTALDFCDETRSLRDAYEAARSARFEFGR